MDTLDSPSSPVRAYPRLPRALVLEAVTLPGREGAAINRAPPAALIGGVQPCELVPGKGIFIGEFDLIDESGKNLGVRTRWYDAVVEFGKAMTFEEAAVAVAGSNSNSRGGLRLDPSRYKVDLLEQLAGGTAFEKHVIAPLAVVREIYKLRNGSEYMRVRNMSLPGSLITVAIGPSKAHWQWSCEPNPRYPEFLQAVDFSDGGDDWGRRDRSRLSFRACFAELVP